LSCFIQAGGGVGRGNAHRRIPFVDPRIDLLKLDAEILLLIDDVSDPLHELRGRALHSVIGRLRWDVQPINQSAFSEYDTWFDHLRRTTALKPSFSKTQFLFSGNPMQSYLSTLCQSFVEC